MNIKVTKRSGKIVELNLEKWQAQVAKVCEGVSDVSQSMIEITSQPHFFDGITTREIMRNIDYLKRCNNDKSIIYNIYIMEIQEYS